MEKIKRSRNSNVHNSDETKKKKINGKCCVDTNWFITHFEDLSNDVMYEIFEYLDFLHVYQAFYDLNIRFRKLLTSSNLPIKINISSISKSAFQRYYTHIILPHQHRISSLCITNSLSFDLDISPHRILSIFNQLETLILENINSNYLKTVLQDITFLPNLASLIIIPADNVEDANDLFIQIFHLSALKYCKVSFANNQTETDPLPFATHKYSPIEQLVIRHEISVNNLQILLSNVPQLRRLSFDCISEGHSSRIAHPIALNNLSHLFIKQTRFSFAEFELLTKNSFCSVQVLHLHVEDREEYIDAYRWEQFISSYLPYLRIFDIRCSYRYVRNSAAQLAHEFRLNQFTEPFWSEHQWFFTYQDYFQYGYHYIIFYSTNPYRRKDYKFKKKPNKQNHFNGQEMNLSSVRHVHILDEEAIIDCIHHFPNATDLILKDISFQKTNSFITTLIHIIPLQSLTKLIIEGDNYSCRKLIELLSLTPNIDTLKIQSILLYSEECLAIKNSENFQSVSNISVIKNLTVKEVSEIEKVELLFALCPRLEQFTIEDRWARVEELLRLLLLKNNKNSRHMFSLCITNENKRLPNKLDTLIKGGKLLDNYFIKSDYPKLYLWW